MENAVWIVMSKNAKFYYLPGGARAQLPRAVPPVHCTTPEAPFTESRRLGVSPGTGVGGALPETW